MVADHGPDVRTWPLTCGLNRLSIVPKSCQCQRMASAAVPCDAVSKAAAQPNALRRRETPHIGADRRPDVLI
jgi:hypothetical protein